MRKTSWGLRLGSQGKKFKVELQLRSGSWLGLRLEREECILFHMIREKKEFVFINSNLPKINVSTE